MSNNEPAPRTTQVAAYKDMLSAIMDRRPSGTRQRLAAALGKNRSFVSQITNPLYPTPIPAGHLDTIFEVCHFSPDEKKNFLEFYHGAHPKRHVHEKPPAKQASHTLTLPDLGDAAANAKLHALLSGLVKEISLLIESSAKHGKKP